MQDGRSVEGVGGGSKVLHMRCVLLNTKQLCQCAQSLRGRSRPVLRCRVHHAAALSMVECYHQDG